MTVLAVVELKCRPGAQAEFLRTMKRPLELTRANPECGRVGLYRSEDVPEVFVLLEEWTSVEAHGRHFEALMAAGELEATKPTWDGMPSSVHYRPLP